MSVAWTVTQPCVEDYRITLCPIHHEGEEEEGEEEVGEEEEKSGGWWGRRKRRSPECWHGNFSQPVLEEEEDFHLTIHLEELKDFTFAFKECGHYELSIQVWYGTVWYGMV